MTNTALILGGNGSIGRAIAQQLADEYQIVLVDIRPVPQLPSNYKFIKQNVLEKKALADCISQHQPDLVINAINLATIFSDQPPTHYQEIISFYLELYQALADLKKSAHYIHIGTTGTGGLGFNVPFSHGEKLEELSLIHKAAFAGIGTGLLTILSRSFPTNQVTISELKPGMAIFNQSITQASYKDCRLVLIDGGENGQYTYNELAILTAFMDFTTTDRIVQETLAIIHGRPEQEQIASHDLVATTNQAILRMNQQDQEQLEHILSQLKAESGVQAIIATGALGPPSLTGNLIIGRLLLDHDPILEPDQFNQKLAASPSIQATLDYIGKTKPELGSYLKDYLTHSVYLLLAKTLSKTAQNSPEQLTEPWQVVAQFFRDQQSTSNVLH